jgi:hypothetical protein
VVRRQPRGERDQRIESINTLSQQLVRSIKIGGFSEVSNSYVRWTKD